MPLELAVARVLRAGVLASSAALAAGLIASLLAPEGALAARLLTGGVLALLATPALRVMVSIGDYLRERDWLFALLTLIVLLELAGSVAAAFYGVGP
jgi:uncharacterized membrane protein